MEITELKKQAAEYAVKFVQSGMVVGLGHGSTAIWAVRRIGELVKSGELHDIVGIPCSLTIEQEAHELGIPLSNFAQHPVVDVTIDGADEVDPNLELIKGGGGALLREKIVAQASSRQIIVVDDRKLSPALGSRFAVPVEVIPFGWQSQLTRLEAVGAQWQLRQTDKGVPFETDQGNYILDCNFGPMKDPFKVAAELNELATVVEHGLFLKMATDVIVAAEDGIRHLTRSG